MTWLITGGAGYIGAHVVRALVRQGLDVVVLDDLSGGQRERVPYEVPFVLGSVGDPAKVRQAIREYGVGGIIHLAAKKAAGESVERPLYYYRQNVTGMQVLVEAMLDLGVDRIVLSSSAAVYGTPAGERVTEQSPVVPESPYGETKLISEWLMRDVATVYNWRWASLRYFNVAGAGMPELGDMSVANLIPMVFQALTRGERPKVFGDDYPTRDGTCIRDYIHVEDLAEAHVVAVQRIEEKPGGEVWNVGRGQGVTVKEVMETVQKVTGLEVDYEVVGRRAGDPAKVVASADKIRRELGWSASRDLEAMIRSAWTAWTSGHDVPGSGDAAEDDD